MTPIRLAFKLLPILVLAALALPASSSAQATRTWVSGVGDDANPCSRTAPCKTFAGAISKTATKGEINCLDPGGFGGVTITKAITIKCHYTEGGVLVSGTNAIVVNAPADARVILKGLDINGIGTGLNAIRVLSAKMVAVIDTEISRFVRNGIDFEPSSAQFRGIVQNVEIEEVAGNGILLAPTATGSTAKATVKDSLITGGGCGATVTSNLPDAAFNFTSDCGISGNPGQFAQLNLINNVIADNEITNGAGVFSKGGSAFARISNNDIVGNTNGLRAINGGQITSFGGNLVDGNTNNGAPTATVTKAKRSAR